MLEELHELNTPLGVVRLSAEMLISALEAGEENHDIFIKYLNQIVNSTDKMTNIVKQVSRFSRNDDLGKKLYCDINELIQNVVVMYGKLFKTDDISLEMKLGKNIPLLYLDPSQIQTVITDLINNARDSLSFVESKNERHVILETSYHVELESISFSILDNGRIMDESSIENIFKSFFAPNDISLNGKTTLGLGLSVSYGIIQRCGGIMSVESKEDLGTKFTVLLPLINEKTETL